MADRLVLQDRVEGRPLDEWGPVSVELLGAQTRIVHGERWHHRVIDMGQGEPLLLYHGIGGHAETYARNLRNLAEHFHVYAVDALFHGFSATSGWDDQKWNLVQADGVADLIRALGHDYAHVEGESMGARITFEFGMKYPELAGKLVMNTGFGAVQIQKTDFVQQPGGGSALQDLSQESVVNPTLGNIRKRMEWLVASPGRMTEEMVRIRHRLYEFPEVYDSMQRVYQIGKTWSRYNPWTEADCERFAPPALVFWTEKNPGQGPDYGEYCADLIPGAKFYNMLDAAHWPQWEKPEEHDQVLIEFLKG